MINNIFKQIGLLTKKMYEKCKFPRNTYSIKAKYRNLSNLKNQIILITIILIQSNHTRSLLAKHFELDPPDRGI